MDTETSVVHSAIGYCDLYPYRPYTAKGMTNIEI